jgi:hypothetical protein
MRYARKSRRPGQPAAPSESTWGTCEHNAIPRQLRRRRAASWRLPPLDCGCRDPWPCRCTEPPLSAKMLDAGRQAAEDILRSGYVPLLQFEVLRALYRRGGSDRALAEQLHELTGGPVA